MKKINYLTLALVALTVAASATVYYDDFESYPVGYDIGDSPNWTDEFTIYSNFVVDEQGGNKYIHVSGIGMPVYGYTPPGEIADSKISFDFFFTGNETYVNANYRVNGNYERGYVVSCFNEINGVYGAGDYVMIGYHDENGFVWYGPNIYFVEDYFDTDTWYHVEAALDGYPTVNYDVTVNADLHYTGSLDMYPVETGYCGVSVKSWHTGTTYVDNYEVDDSPRTGIESASLGEIKASFR